MNIIDEKELKKDHLLKAGPNSKIYVLSDGRLYKRLSNLSLANCNDTGVGLDFRLDSSKELTGIEGIVLPEDIVYEYERCIGYTMEYVKGISIYEYIDSKNAHRDLEFYSNLFKELENIIIRMNEVGASNPDMLTLGNILVSDNKIKLIDYDGINMEYPAISISDCLGDIRRYIDSKKFCSGYYMFNKELDKVSLLLLYLRLVFNVRYVDINSKIDGNNIYLSSLYDELGMYDKDLQYMINATFSLGKNGFYIGDIDNIIRSKFELEDNGYKKRLIKK